MRLGIEYDETHRGTYYLVDAPTVVRPFAFQLHIATPKIREFLRENSALAEGFVDAEGLATHAQAAGLVTWKRATRRIAYSLEFSADDGRLLAFVGEKDLHLMLGKRALTQLGGSLFHLPGPGTRLCQSAARQEIGRASLHFDLKHDFWPMMQSARLLIPGFALGWPGTR